MFLYYLCNTAKNEEFISRDGGATPTGTPYMGIEPRGLWFLSVRMKKQEFCHIYGCFLGWLCVLVDLFDVFHGFQQ